MKFMRSIRKFDTEEKQESRFSSAPSLVRIAAAFAFAAALGLAPLPTFAQHGGGGGGGAHGGGGGGGSHASSGGGGSHATSSGSGHPSGAAAPASASGGSSSGRPPVSSGATGSSYATESTGNVAGAHFAANNNTWQEPPATGARATSATHAAVLPRTGMTGAGTSSAVAARASGPVASVAHVPVPRRPIIFAPFNPFFPGFGFGFGFGLGFGGFSNGAFGPCDPFWGCYGYGYGYGGSIGYGYYGGGSFDSSGYNADVSYSGEEDASPSQETNPSLYVQGPETLQQPQTANAGPSENPVIAVLYLKNGSSYAVTDYWLADGKVHYVTSYGGENSVEESDLDLQRTVNENASQGLTFTLRPAPGSPAAAPQQSPVAPQ